MKRIFWLAALGIVLSLGCKKDLSQPTPQEDQLQDAQYFLELAEEMIAKDETEIEFRGTTVTVPAGSSNALQAAINTAGPNGIVVLAPGMHTEDGTVTVSHRVKITGQAGAVLEFNSSITGGFPYVVDPGLHILNAGYVIVENLTIQDADNAGSTGIFVQGSNQTRIRNNSIIGFELGIAMYQTNNTRIRNNTIDGEVSFGGVGILNVVGDNTLIYDNDVIDNGIEVFVGDKGGLLKDNFFSGTGNIGILLCTPNIGGAYLVLPDGTTAVADESANEWLAINNYSENHVWNYLVIDNANNNNLVNNNAANAVLADIEMAGDSERFGFFTPTSFGNLTISTALPDVTIKVCGTDNDAIGGTLIDTNAFPCD
jgi:parallel beta-helix repeat protein